MKARAPDSPAARALGARLVTAAFRSIAAGQPLLDGGVHFALRLSFFLG